MLKIDFFFVILTLCPTDSFSLIFLLLDTSELYKFSQTLFSIFFKLASAGVIFMDECI